MRKILVAWALLHVVVSAIAGPKEDALQIVDRWTQAFADSDVDGIVKTTVGVPGNGHPYRNPRPNPVLQRVELGALK